MGEREIERVSKTERKGKVIEDEKERGGSRGDR